MTPQQHVRNTEPAFSLGHSSSPQTRTMACSHAATCSHSLPFVMVSITIIHVNTWSTTHLLTPEGWKAEFAEPVY